MTKNHDIIEIDDLLFKHETEKAYGFLNEDGDLTWIPKSKCDYDKSNNILQLPEWLAIEKELI